jgi:GAF domain-containing protein
MNQAPTRGFLTDQLAECTDLAGATGVLSVTVRERLGADGATVVLRDGDCCFYADEDAVGPLWKGKRFPLEKCISGWAMIHGVPVAIADIYADPRIPWDAYRPTFVKSLAMAPVGASPIAALGAYWANRHFPTDDELRALRELGKLAEDALRRTFAAAG